MLFPLWYVVVAGGALFFASALRAVVARYSQASRFVESSSHRDGDSRPVNFKPHFVVLFDGYCVLCNCYVQFCLSRCGPLAFHVAPLKSDVGRRILDRHGIPRQIDSFVFVEFPEEGSRSPIQAFTRSDAALKSLSLLSPRGMWVLMMLFWPVPRRLRDAVYNVGWRYRRKIFGTIAEPREWPGKVLKDESSIRYLYDDRSIGKKAK